MNIVYKGGECSWTTYRLYSCTFRLSSQKSKPVTTAVVMGNGLPWVPIVTTINLEMIYEL